MFEQWPAYGTEDLGAGLVMLMVDNCHNLLNLGHKLAHLSHMNMEKFNPLTCSFSPQYHPWVTCKGHEKKGNDQQHETFSKIFQDL